MRIAMGACLVLAACVAARADKPPLTEHVSSKHETGVRSAIAITPGVAAPFTMEPVGGATLFNGDRSYTVQIPVGTTQAVFELRTETPEVDTEIYIRRGGDVFFSGGGVLADYGSSGPGGNETVTVSNPPPGTYYVALALFTPNVRVTGTVRVIVSVPACVYQLSTSTLNLGSGGATGSINLTVGAGCSWSALSNVPWMSATPAFGAGPAVITYRVDPNPEVLRRGNLTIGGVVVAVSQSGGPVAPPTIRFTAVTPCRAVDTRTGEGKTGEFGPPALAGNVPRTFTIPASGCGIPATARAYSMNVTVVPPGPLDFLTLYPAGGTRPPTSTLNSPLGRVVSNAAIVQAGADGAITVYAPNPTHLIIDINGYFSEAPDALSFFVTLPCRAVDTRPTEGVEGAFGAPVMAAGTTRNFPLVNSRCRPPAAVTAYSINATVVPTGALSYLSLWPSGVTRPLVSTLNSFDGRVLANAAILPATSPTGSISAFVTDATHLIIDINGYFAPNTFQNGLAFYPIDPCRAVDTRNPAGTFGGPFLSGGTQRDFPVRGTCDLRSTALAYSLNVTVVPRRPLSYLTVWPAGFARPFVSTLNAFDGSVVANAALVPAGVNGSVSVFATDDTDVIMDVNGYFAVP